VLLRKVWPNWNHTIHIVKPAIVVRWHRCAFAGHWRWDVSATAGRPACRRAGRPRADPTHGPSESALGCPRIHGELLKLGLEVSQTTVAKYLPRRDRPPSPTWRVFLQTHMSQIVSLDFFTVPTATFGVLFVLVVLSHQRRRIVHLNVTAHPTSAWTRKQLRESFVWDDAPRFLLRDRDRIYASDFTRTVEAMGIEEMRTAPRSPWQNPFVERVIGSLRRECLDHVIIWNERSLRRMLQAYLAYYHHCRKHVALAKDSPVPRRVQPRGRGGIIEVPHVGGLHHHYERRAA
jgi:putative transposase